MQGRRRPCCGWTPAGGDSGVTPLLFRSPMMMTSQTHACSSRACAVTYLLRWWWDAEPGPTWQSPEVSWISPPAAQGATDVLSECEAVTDNNAWGMYPAHGPLWGGRGSLLLQPWGATGVCWVPFRAQISSQWSKAPLTSWISRHKDGVLRWASLAGLWMGKGQVSGHLKEKIAGDDVEGDNTAWSMSPGKQRMWEQDEVRDTAKERRWHLCRKTAFPSFPFHRQCVY